MDPLQRKEIIDRIFTYTTQGIKYDLDRIEQASERLGRPQDSFKSIHVAGTNGKGSVCAYLESTLRQSGYLTGMYTSPHLVDFEERFVIAGVPVEPDEWLSIFPLIDPLITDLALSFFEITTLICFELFKRRGVEWAVIETGMGGRLDATNVLKPALCIITVIDMDHMAYLGNDLMSIANEKLGIVKEGTPLVMIRPTLPALQRKVRARCQSRRAPLVWVDQKLIREFSFSQGRASFYWGDQFFTLPLSGKHQVFNALCAIKAMETLHLGDQASLKEGIESTSLAGRFQIVSIQNKTIVFDVGHNPGAAHTVAETLRARFPAQKVGFVIGMMKDKDIKGFLHEIASLADYFWFCQPDIERACSAHELPGLLPNDSLTGWMVRASVGEVLHQALKSSCRVICVTGSFYTVAEAMTSLKIKRQIREAIRLCV